MHENAPKNFQNANTPPVEKSSLVYCYDINQSTQCFVIFFLIFGSHFIQQYENYENTLQDFKWSVFAFNQIFTPIEKKAQQTEKHNYPATATAI